MEIMCEDYETEDPVYPKLRIMVTPKDGFDDYGIKVHDIAANQVKNRLNFKEVWKEIEKYFTNVIVKKIQ